MSWCRCAALWQALCCISKRSIVRGYCRRCVAFSPKVARLACALENVTAATQLEASGVVVAGRSTLCQRRSSTCADECYTIGGGVVAVSLGTKPRVYCHIEYRTLIACQALISWLVALITRPVGCALCTHACTILASGDETAA